MVFNYIGDVDSVKEDQKEFINDVLEMRGFKDCDVLVEPVGKAGDNFIANVKRIIVNQHGNTLKMIAKLASEINDMLGLDVVYTNEHVVYTELFPKFKELQKNAGVPETEWFRHAECYGTSIKAFNEVILLEDLKESNFDLLCKYKPLTNDSVKLVLKSFAVYHSLSYVLKKVEPETYVEIKSKFLEIYTDKPTPSLEIKKQFVKHLEENGLDNLDDERQKAAFKGSISNILELMLDLTKMEKDSKYSVIQQGDGWINNIMFALEDDKPKQCVLIDYQMAKEGNPMYDVMYMIFNCTGTEQRIEHYTEFIDYYYNELDKSLRNYGLKVSDVYPREQLSVDMKKYAKSVLAVSVIVTNLIVKEVEEADKLLETMKTTEKLEETMAAVLERNDASQELFKIKLIGLVKSFIELDLL